MNFAVLVMEEDLVVVIYEVEFDAVADFELKSASKK